MPIVCVKRPNRKVPRHWMASDLCRVAGYVSRYDGPDEVLRCGLKGAGVYEDACASAKAVAGLLSILKLIQVILGTLAAQTAIRIVLTILKRSRLVKVPRVGLVVLWLIAILEAIEAAQKDYEALVGQIEKLLEFAERLEKICST